MRTKKKSDKQRNQARKELISNKRKNEEYKNEERLKNKETMKKIRLDEEYKERERLKDSESKKKMREDEEYKERERLKDSESKKKMREDEEYKERERLKDSESKKKMREDEEYKERERLKDSESKKKMREDEEYKERERLKDSESKKKMREDEEYKERERLKDSESKKKMREDKEYKERERVKNVDSMRKIREDEAYKERERLKDSESKKKMREDEEYKERERLKNRESKKKMREDEEYKQRERLKDSESKKKMREDEMYKEIEQIKNKDSKKRMRTNEDFRQKERERDRIAKQNKRSTDLFRQRTLNYNNFLRNQSTAAKLKLQFLKDRSCVPDLVCCCCEGLFFPHSVVKYNEDTVRTKYSDDLHDKVFNFDSPYICKTCNISVSKCKIPKLATSNGLKFPDVPNCVKMISSLEERMVAPYINFMQIRPLKAFALNPQFGIKGSVVNIPIEVNDVLQVLPRKFDNMATLQIKLRRHMQHSTHYMFESIRPAVVCEALKYLIETPLYKKYDINIDQAYFQRYENKYSEQVDFVVDKSDMVDNEDDMDEIMKDIEDVDFESDFELEENGTSDEVMLVDRNKEIADKVKIIAPGQGNIPVPWHMVEDIDELCFPKIFGGHKLDVPKFVSYSDRAKSESRRRDRRSCVPTRILYMAKKKLELTCIASLNICLRKTKRTGEIKVGNVLNTEYLDNLVKLDEGYRFLRQVRSSPSYWENKKKDLMAMIRQLGKPTIFLTLSAAETWWPELIKTLVKLNCNETISLEDALNLDAHEKTELIRNDPVTCARYFDYKANKFVMLLKQKDSIFGNYLVEDSYERVEFQMRGSPHEHIFLWLKDAPKYDPSNPQSVEECITFIDTFITCHYDENDPYMAVQRHKHTHTCYKGKKNEQKCRFNFPLPVMPRTMILEPLGAAEKPVDVRESLLKIRKLMIHLYKKQVQLSFDDVLLKLDMTEEQYIYALRSSLKRVQVFLKRSSLEVGINCYNKSILHLFEANIDVQFVLEEYGIASYIINYIGKVDAGLSKLLRDAAAEANREYRSIKDKFRKIANVFLNSNLMSAQEASYHVLSLPLSKSSRQTIFINTSPITERAMMLKTNTELGKLDKDSTDVFMDDFMTKYSRRTAAMENACLADFVSNYYKKAANRNENEDNLSQEYVTRQRPAVIRYRRYKLAQDPANYYREQVLLFLPWRNERTEVENANCEMVYHNNENRIEENRQKYSILRDEDLDDALEDAQNEIADIEQVDIDNYAADKLSPDQQVDILQQEGKQIVNDRRVNRFTCPKRVSEKDLLKLMHDLNSSQREFVMHILKRVKSELAPLRIFLSGSAGVGKSTVINCLYQLVTNHFDNIPGADKDRLVVLLCAPSGKAAYLINGVTLHTAFALPVSQFGGQMPELAGDLANSIREKLFSIKLLIVDEVSMVGSTLLSRVDTRLRQIMGVNQAFGGVSVLLVGDLNQLPPVMDSPVFKISNSHEMKQFLDVNPLWDEFVFFELTEIMRQKDEKMFIEALNNLAIGQMTVDDINLVKSRKVNESVVPQGAIRLYAENKNVDSFNEARINMQPGTEYVSEAKDVILGKVSEVTRNRVLESLKYKSITDVNGLPYKIRFKLGLKYMVTNNIDVEDGLVNGACGILRHISFEPNSNKPVKIWLDFQSNKVGEKARLPLLEYMKSEGIDKTFTPISKNSVVLSISNKLQHQTIRKQFPVVPAEALTIHKSQGQTYNEICLDLRRSRRMTRQMLYVALSRVTKLSGLYVLGEFKPPILPKKDDPILSELNRLRTKRKLQLCYNDLTQTHGGTTIIYQNVCALMKKLEYILRDEWYQRGDVLIFSETLSRSSDIIKVPHFREIFRSDTKGCSRGVIGFARNDIVVTDINHVLDISDRNSSHVELIGFKIGDSCIVSGYKSPSCSNGMFEKNLTAILSQTNTETVVIGDFNFDMKCHPEESVVKKLFNQYNLRTLLPADTSTTEMNTQIDIVFSTNSLMTAGVYETYFSYHKPVFVILNSNNMEVRNDEVIISPNNTYEKTENTSPRREFVSEESSENFVGLNTEQYIKDKRETSLLLGMNLNTSGIMNTVQSQIYNIDPELPAATFRDSLRQIYISHEDLCNTLMTAVGQVDSAIFENHPVDFHRKNKIYDALKQAATVVRTAGDGSCLFRSFSLCLFGTEELHVSMRILCCLIFENHWPYFDQMRSYLSDFRSMQSLIHKTAKRDEWGDAIHIKAMSVASHRDIYLYNQINENDVDRYDTLENLQSKCDANLLSARHLLYSSNLGDQNVTGGISESGNTLKPIAVLYTDNSHYSAVLPKGRGSQLLRPKTRGDSIPSESSQPMTLIDTIEILN